MTVTVGWQQRQVSGGVAGGVEVVEVVGPGNPPVRPRPAPVELPGATTLGQLGVGVVRDARGVRTVGILSGVSVEALSQRHLPGVQASLRRHSPAVVHVGQRVVAVQIVGEDPALRVAQTVGPPAVVVRAAGVATMERGTG